MNTMRKELHEVLGHVAYARIAMDVLKLEVLREVQHGNYPTYRGHYWSKVQYDALQKASDDIESAFQYLKYLQFPERGLPSEQGPRPTEVLSKLHEALIGIQGQ